MGTDSSFELLYNNSASSCVSSIPAFSFNNNTPRNPHSDGDTGTSCEFSIARSESTRGEYTSSLSVSEELHIRRRSYTLVDNFGEVYHFTREPQFQDNIIERHDLMSEISERLSRHTGRTTTTSYDSEGQLKVD